MTRTDPDLNDPALDVSATPELAETTPADRRASWRRWRRPRRSRPNAVIDSVTIVVVAIIVLSAVAGPFFAPDVFRSHIEDSLLPPSATHWFGTDEQGRDVFWRIVVGARETLTASVIVVVGYSIVGVIIASAATLGPKWLREIMSRFIDLGLAFPSLVFSLGVAAALGPSLATACVALIVTGWPGTARLLQGIMRETIAQPFVESARVLGVSPLRLTLRHVLPNALPALYVKWAGDIGNTVLVLGALSFIGAGAQPPSAEWGAMVSSARGLVSTAWWAAFFPGIAIAITTAAFGLLGDFISLRVDPTARAKGRA
jgi:peptide/nickel transport system permease protein